MHVKKHITLRGTACKLRKIAYINIKDMHIIVDTLFHCKSLKKLPKKAKVRHWVKLKLTYLPIPRSFCLAEDISCTTHYLDS